MTNPEGNGVPGDEKQVTLTESEYKELTTKLADATQGVASLTQDIQSLRKERRENSGSGQEASITVEEVNQTVEEALRKRDAESLKQVQQQALEAFLDAHPEFSKEEDTDGSKFAAYQKALNRISLAGVKTRQEYEQVLEDAYRLTDRSAVQPQPSNFPSTKPIAGAFPNSRSSIRLPDSESKLVQTYFNGDVEAYLKKKAKHPEYMEELLQWVR